MKQSQQYNTKKISAIISLSILLTGCTTVDKPSHSNVQYLSRVPSADSIEKSRQLGCDLTIGPEDSFYSAFGRLSSGQLLCLQDGVYNQSMDIPSSIRVRALNDGKAELDGRNLNSGWTAILSLHGNNSSVRGLKVHHASRYADACSIRGKNNSFRVMSCSHGGKHKHKIPLKVGGQGHLIEDSWFYGEGRYVVQCFKGRAITFRRNVARWDSTLPHQPTEPNATFSIYNCSGITIENNISLDYGTPETPMKFGGDFYGPQNSTVWPEGNQDNQWLGNIAINHSLDTLNCRALRLDPTTPSKNNVIKDFYVRNISWGIIGNSRTGTLKVESCTMINVEHVGFNQGYVPIVCKKEADISKRYVNRVKTNEPLFPWKNEDLIKADMCKPGERQSQWCTSGQSLTNYVLGQL